jgi:hypothetical protein
MPGSGSYIPVSFFTPFYLLLMVTHLCLFPIIHLRLYIYSSFYLQTTLSRYHRTRLRVSPTYTYLFIYSLTFTYLLQSFIYYRCVIVHSNTISRYHRTRLRSFIYYRLWAPPAPKLISRQTKYQYTTTVLHITYNNLRLSEPEQPEPRYLPRCNHGDQPQTHHRYDHTLPVTLHWYH